MMFRNQFLFSAMAVITLVTSGCSFAGSLYIYNNTKNELVIESVFSEGERELKAPLAIPILSGLPIPTVYDSGHGWNVFARSGNCKLKYFIPSGMTLNHAYWDEQHKAPSNREMSAIRLQVEPNFNIHLIPQTKTTIVNVNDFKHMQEGGFPLIPIENSCASSD